MNTLIELIPVSVSPKTGEIKIFAKLESKEFPSHTVNEKPIKCAEALFESIFSTTAEWPRFSLIDADLVGDNIIISYSVMIPEDIMSFDKDLYRWHSLIDFSEEHLDKIRKSIRF